MTRDGSQRKLSLNASAGKPQKFFSNLMAPFDTGNSLNHCMHGSAMQVVIGHIAFKGEMANFDLSYLRHR
jgi:hypothetical protein